MIGKFLLKFGSEIGNHAVRNVCLTFNFMPWQSIIKCLAGNYLELILKKNSPILISQYILAVKAVDSRYL